MKRGKKSVLPRYIFVWGSIAIAAFGYVMATTQANRATENGKGTVNPASQAQAASPAIPPVDKDIPTIIETASFGLG